LKKVNSQLLLSKSPALDIKVSTRFLNKTRRISYLTPASENSKCVYDRGLFFVRSCTELGQFDLPKVERSQTRCLHSCTSGHFRRLRNALQPFQSLGAERKVISSPNGGLLIDHQTYYKDESIVFPQKKHTFIGVCMYCIVR